MKEIFDWMRGQVPEKILPKVPVTSIEQCARASCYNKMLAVIDEAEAKWEAVIEQMEEYRAKFDCRVCKHTKTEGQFCKNDCTDALIDGMLEILKGKISEVE